MSTTFDKTHETDTDSMNTLIETLKDGEAGFRAAADDVVNADLKSTFHHYAISAESSPPSCSSLSCEKGKCRRATVVSAA